MRQDPFGQQGGHQQYGQAPRRRGFNIGSLRWLILLGFVAYGGCYYLSNRSVDPYTGETVLIDASIGPEQERAMGLQAYQEILSQERPLPKSDQTSQQIQEIAQSSFLFRIGEFGLSCVNSMISVISALATAIATIGAGFYSLFRTLYMVAKIAMVGGGAYLGLKLYEQYKRSGSSSTPALPAAAANPARRRRRSSKRGSRARYYLR